ncbi:T9SS type A sorting domain-containing protein [Flavobacterium sp. W22_SRS_FP1]|uniref:T9SS type A sorting domain-containing protein n=1 Tax=Flavobacterium sp. W22_SRS_FP1 TaxID=3240276 RepID=UPI003F910C7B
MKKITLLFFLLTFSLGYSQVVLENFSSGITTSNWKGDQGLGSATTETLSPNGLAGKIITSNAAGANPWQNAQLYMQSNYIDLSTTKVVTVDVYSTTAFAMLAKVVDGKSGPESAAEAAHTGSGWETLSFNFSAPKDGTAVANGEYARILFFPLWKLGGGFNALAVTTTYVDNVKAIAGAAIVAAAEISAGPANPPARSTSDYVSFYNGIASPVAPQYTNLAGVIFDKFGTSTSIDDLILADGNTVKKYTNHNYSGIGGGDVDVSTMTKFHIDVYSPNFTSLSIKFEDVNKAAKEIVVVGAKTQGAWNSYDLDLSTYPGVDLAHLKWIVPVTNAGTTMYVDNVYFYKPAAADPVKIASLSDLKVDGVSVAGFAAGTLNYSVVLPKETTTIPQITAVTTTNSAATQIITQALALPGDATVDVTSEDGTVTATYTVSYTLDASTACQGTSKEVPTNGTAFSEGYTYKFETLANGTDVKITFTVLDTDKPGMANVELFRSPSTFTAMTLVSGQQYSAIITGQLPGAELSLAGRFPYAEGGVIQTKNFKYIVGDNCSAGNGGVKVTTLTDLKVDAQTVAGFAADKLNYSLVLPKGTTTIPQITAVTTTNSLASIAITQASALPGDANVVVTSEDGTITSQYTVSFTLDASTDCEGTSKEAFDGSFSEGYTYKFETLANGTDVKITFTVLDTDKEGIANVELFRSPSTFTPMTLVSGQQYTVTIMGQDPGAELSLAAKFPYAAGGVAQTKNFKYTVGDRCESITTVTIDGSSELTGYLNWFNKDGSYASGSAWGIADVKTVSDATADTVSLSPNFSTYNTTDSYWSDGAGKGNKIIEGNSFIENSALAGQILTFNGDVASNTLADGYTAIAFIKGLDPNNGYTDVLGITAPLVAGQAFSITTTTAISAGLIVQYGFTIKGLNGNPADEAALGKVVIGKIAVSEPSSTVTIDGSSELTGYLNWFNKDGSYASGSAWGIADVKTVSDATADTVSLSPNFSTYNATDSYWSDGAGKGNKIIEGNSFIENSALAGQILTFNGDVASNTLADGYTAIAFIKGLDPNNGYTDVLGITAPLIAGQAFSITTTTAIPAGLIVQYGFTIKGLNGNPADEAALGKVVIGKTTLGTTKFEISNVKMYPNPVKNNLTIEANSTIERVSVYNILGQEVLTTRPSANAATLQTSNLQKGIYIVKTEIDGKVSASKIIKE